MRPASEQAAGSGVVLARRAALVAGALLLGAASGRGACAAPGPVRFRILREGSAIGTHAVTLEDGPEGTRVARSAIDVVVRFAGIVVYRYWHRFAETWGPEGRLVAVASRLERNGTPTALDGRVEGAAFLLTGPEGTQRLPAEVAPLSWWDPSIFRRPLFDARTGRALRVHAERAALPGGGFSLRVTGDGEGTATYDATGRWTFHVMKGEDGSTVTYERIG
jgi:hypothetical protein